MDDSNQAKLQEIIKNLSTENKISEDWCRENYINELKTIYQDDDFRHLYSGIFGVITSLSTERRDSLGQNFVIVYEAVKAKYAKDAGGKDYIFYLKVRKLYDHVYLDIGRIEFWENMQRSYSTKFQKTEDAQIRLVEKLNKQKRKVSKLMERLERAKTEYITILGIFAAIILGAVGSLTYAGKVIGAVSEPSADLTRLIIISTVLGAVLVSIINAFLSFILRINSNDERPEGWSWWKCLAMIFISGVMAIAATKLLGL